MAIDEIFTLLASLQRSGRVLAPNLLGKAAEAVEESRNPAVSALKTIGGGLTLAPLVKGLLRLFGGGEKKKELPPLERFDLPAPIRTEIGLSQTGETYVVDRGAGDRVRRVADPVPAPIGTAPASSAPPPASITVNISAMDSQSFLDRQDDIARAVREAMLHSHPVNDVVSEI